MEVNIYTVAVDAPGENYGIAAQARLLASSLSRTDWAGEFAVIGNRAGFAGRSERLPVIDIAADGGGRVKGAMSRYAQWLKFFKAGDLPASWFEPGKAILFSDTDCLFLQDPTETITKALADADIAFVVEGGMDVGKQQFSRCLSRDEVNRIRAAKRWGVNSGCWAVRSERAMDFFQHWKRIHIERGPAGDQNYFQRIVQLHDGGFKVAQLPPAKFTFPMYVMPRWTAYTRAVHLHFCGLRGCTEKLKAMYGVHQSIYPHRGGELMEMIREVEIV